MEEIREYLRTGERRLTPEMLNILRTYDFILFDGHKIETDRLLKEFRTCDQRKYIKYQPIKTVSKAPSYIISIASGGLCRWYRRLAGDLADSCRFVATILSFLCVHYLKLVRVNLSCCFKFGALI